MMADFFEYPNVERALCTLPALFARAVEAFPERVAVSDSDRQLTYGQLDALASSWARALEHRGIVAADRVVLVLPRSVTMIVALCALVKSGCTLVPATSDIPPGRLEFIVEDSGAKAVLASRAQGAALPQRIATASVIAVESLPVDPAGFAARAVSPEDQAYIIYTSGTTGAPKGVLTSHAAIATRYRDWADIYCLEQAPLRILQVAKAGFDVFIGDVVKALGSGGTLVICPDMAVLDPAELYRCMNGQRIDYVDIVPAVLRNLVEYLRQTQLDLSSLAMLNCGADLWSKAEYLGFREVLKVGRLFNSYGVTECSVESLVFEDDGRILAAKPTLPIGRALRSDRVLIVDEQLQPLPSNQVGQLCLGGPCLSLGYVNLPERNRQAFVMLDTGAGRERFYLTGDLARVDDAGIVEFLGRTDSQIKIHGNRVELHEIERVLERDPAVKQAVAHFDAERSSLHAFVVPVPGARFDPAELATSAAHFLPAYMRPATIAAVERIPLSENHKVDRQALYAAWRETGAAAADRPRKKRPTELYQSRTLDELIAALAARDLHIPALISEFIKPTAKRAILVTGSLAEQTASPVSDLDLLVLLDSRQAFKKLKAEIYGHHINYLPAASEDEKLLSIFLQGLEVECHFLVNECLARGTAPADIDIVASRRPHLATNSKFLSRLNSRWIVHDDGLLPLWRHCYELDRFRIRRISEEFISAAKNLEDMAEAIGEDGTHVAVIGMNLVTYLMRALLASQDYFGKSLGWMRKVNRTLPNCSLELAQLLNRGRELILPGPLPGVIEQRRYFDQIHGFTTEVRQYLSQDQALSGMFDSLIIDLDIILPQTEAAAAGAPRA